MLRASIKPSFRPSRRCAHMHRSVHGIVYIVMLRSCFAEDFSALRLLTNCELLQICLERHSGPKGWSGNSNGVSPVARLRSYRQCQRQPAFRRLVGVAASVGRWQSGIQSLHRRFTGACERFSVLRELEHPGIRISLFASVWMAVSAMQSNHRQMALYFGRAPRTCTLHARPSLSFPPSAGCKPATIRLHGTEVASG